MTRGPFWLIVIVAVVLAVLGGRAISAQDKYTVQVPGGLAFSEFRGYEDWQFIAVSQTGDLIVAILGNPEIIAAYQARVPGNGKPFPDGSKMAKIHWNAKKSAEAPAQTLAGNPPQGNDAKCGFACHTIVKAKDYVFTAYPKR